MKVSLSVVDYVAIVFYFAVVLYIGFKSKRKASDVVEEYLLAGRSLTLPMFVATLVSTWYGGILGVGEFTYKFGISAWLVLGFPYYVFGIIFAFLLAGRINKTKLYTIPDRLEQSYGKGVSVLGSILTLILVTPAPYFLMIGVIIQMIFGFDLVLSVIIGVFISISYLFSGGFRSDVRTDIFEFFLMFIGFGLIVPFAGFKFGGFDFISRNVPPVNLTLMGGNSVQYVIVWFFIALWTMVDPGFYQRCYAARSEKVAKYGIVVSVFFWMLFDAMTVTAGLYARAVLPKLSNPVMAYPALAEVILPKFVKGLFYIGMIATIMSTLNTTAFLSAVTIGNDIIWRLKGGSREKVNFYTRIGLIITAVTSIIFAVYAPSVVEMWYIVGTLAVPGLLIPVVATYFENLTPPKSLAFLVMLSGFLSSFLSFVYGKVTGSYPLGLEPMFPGLILSFLIYTLGMLVRK